MAKFTNFVGDIVNPFFINVVNKGILSPTDEEPRNCFNVFDFKRASNSLAFNPTDIAAKWQLWCANNWMLWATAFYTCPQIELHSLDDPTSAVAIDLTGNTGQDEGDLYASDTAIYFQLKTGFRGRSYFGSKHFGGASEDAIDVGYLSASGVTLLTAFRTALQALATTGFTDTAGNAWKLCLISRELSSLDVSPAIFTGADITSALLNKRIGTMGHRRGNRDAI